MTQRMARTLLEMWESNEEIAPGSLHAKTIQGLIDRELIEVDDEGDYLFTAKGAELVRMAVDSDDPLAVLIPKSKRKWDDFDPIAAGYQSQAEMTRGEGFSRAYAAQLTARYRWVFPLVSGFHNPDYEGGEA